MKKFSLILFALFSINIANAQYVTIPDANFAAWLNANIPSAMNGNQMDTTSTTVTLYYHMDVSNMSITDLTGLQYFTSLHSLDCSNVINSLTPNVLTSLPQLPSGLTSLYCSNNQLTFLPALPNTLIILYCYNNSLTSLPALPTSLKYLHCYSNQLISLPVLPASLLNLQCYYNQITSLPTLPASIQYIDCRFNHITSLPVLTNSLQYFYCDSNQITSLPILPASLLSFGCNNNLLTSLPTLPASLLFLGCGSNQLTSLPILPISLNHLDCYSNQLTNLPALPVSLLSLYCCNNQLTSIPVLPNSLYLLYCFNNQLTSLPALPSSMKHLQCNNNLLSSLPALPDSLEDFGCGNNNISCFPIFPNTLVNFPFMLISGNPFTCLPNYVPSMDATTLAYPLCVTGDTVNNIYNCIGGAGVLGYTYKDNNTNCLKDSNDICLVNVHEFLYDNSNSLLSQTYSAINGVYNFSDTVGIYTIKIDTTNVPFIVLCNNPGIDSTVTLTSANPLVDSVNFSFTCKPGFDVGVQSVVTSGLVFPGQQHSIRIVAGDLSQWYNLNCAAGISGQVQIAVSGPVTYYGITSGTLTPVIAGNVYSYNIADFGNVNINADFGLIFITDSTANTGDMICLNITVNPFSGDNVLINNVYKYCYFVVNSHDPNMKEVYPVSVYTGYPDYFTYTIHFQNTGTAPATYIRLVDTLNANLDLATFQFINYSHYNIVTLNNNVLTVSFPNIQLPDSATDEEASKGFIQYRIKPKANLILGTQITNTAYIYFDYNPPIVTNTTINEFDITGIENPIFNNSLKIYPNPANGTFYIKYDFDKISDEKYEIFDNTGRLVRSSKLIEKEGIVQVDLQTSPPGIYFVRIVTGNKVYSSKVALY